MQTCQAGFATLRVSFKDLGLFLKRLLHCISGDLEQLCHTPFERERDVAQLWQHRVMRCDAKMSPSTFSHLLPSIGIGTSQLKREHWIELFRPLWDFWFNDIGSTCARGYLLGSVLSLSRANVRNSIRIDSICQADYRLVEYELLQSTKQIWFLKNVGKVKGGSILKNNHTKESRQEKRRGIVAAESITLTWQVFLKNLFIFLPHFQNGESRQLQSSENSQTLVILLSVWKKSPAT